MTEPMTKDEKHRFTVRIPLMTYQLAYDLACLEGVSFLDFCERAMSNEVRRCQVEAGTDGRALLDDMRKYRERQVRP